MIPVFESDELHKPIRELQRRRLELLREGKTEETEALGKQLDDFLNGPHDPEYCDECGNIFCPWGEPLHFHHDGCPCCAMVPDEEWNEDNMNRVLLARNL